MAKGKSHISSKKSNRCDFPFKFVNRNQPGLSMKWETQCAHRSVRTSAPPCNGFFAFFHFALLRKHFCIFAFLNFALLHRNFALLHFRTLHCCAGIFAILHCCTGIFAFLHFALLLGYFCTSLAQI